VLGGTMEKTRGKTRINFSFFQATFEVYFYALKIEVDYKFQKVHVTLSA
jgi:hypothetical protein